MTDATATTEQRGRLVVALLALLFVFSAIFVNVTPAKANTATITGWVSAAPGTYCHGTSRVNTVNPTWMSLNPWNGTNLGVPWFRAIARISSPCSGSWMAQTAAVYAGGSSVFQMIPSGSNYIPAGTFWLTTQSGPSGCGCSEDLSWSGTLYWNMAW